MAGSEFQKSILPETSISDLPWEVVQEIFSFLDGKSLIMCKRVCKFWKDHVNYMEKNCLYWYNCTKEISLGAKFDLLDNIFPCHWEYHSDVDWQAIYRSWCFWDELQTFSSSVERFLSGLNSISDIQVSGEWLLVCTSAARSKLIAKNMYKDSVIDVYLGFFFESFELVKSDKQRTSNVIPSETVEDFFNTLDHNEIWIKTRDAYIQLGKDFMYVLDRINVSIRHSYGYQAKLIKEHEYCKLYMTKTCSKVSGYNKAVIEIEMYCSEIAHMWYNRITACSDDMSMVRACTVDMNTQTLDIFPVYSPHLQPGEQQKLYSWNGLLFIIHSNKRRLSIQTRGRLLQFTTDPRKGCITSVFYYSTYLFLGTDRGQLLIYRVKDVVSCWNLSLYGDQPDPTLCCNIHVANAKIIQITVAEISHHNKKTPMILCASPEDVYSVSFQKFRNTEDLKNK